MSNSCYINSLPGLIPSGGASQITSILKEDGTIVQSITNLNPADAMNGAGFNGTSIKSVKMYTDPDGSINIHLDGPVILQDIDVDPWKEDYYQTFISLENAREKWTIYENIGPVKSFADIVS